MTRNLLYPVGSFCGNAIRHLRGNSPLLSKCAPAAIAGIAVVFLIVACPRMVPAQRLSGAVRPVHYSLKLKPAVAAATFSGEESIDIVLEEPAKEITLNAADLKFERVAALSGGITQVGEVSLDAGKEQATLHFAQELQAGPAVLEISYSGRLQDQLRGFYLSKTAQRNYAVTQFESTDARRAFPSFDEPAFKATFDITLIIPAGEMAISNTNLISDTKGPSAGEHTVRFARTPKMSTYLVAFLVGDFQCLSGSSDGVPIRVCAPPEQVKQGAFALSAAEFFLHYYDNYFGIKYPMPKLDMIALPDFEAGAMENFGAITYRETALLLDLPTASVGAQKGVAIDVAHEMAHQWFGDMVTMQWWDNIWLNEGFATWMEGKAVGAWKPEWHMREDAAADLNGTLDVDAQQVTRTIRATADTPDQINEMFDDITYGKAGAVLQMTENYLGEEIFRQGVHDYLAAHLYGNATAEDFWNTQTRVSGKPVDKIMSSLVEQPGEALLTFGPARAGQVEVRQQRFFLNPTVKSKTASVWSLPVCFKGSNGSKCEVLSSEKATLPVPPDPVFYGNAGGTGYYRSQYDSQDYQKLVGHVETELDPVERITLLGSQWALTQAEKTTIADFMTLVDAVQKDRSAAVINTAAQALFTIDQQLISTPEQHRLLAAWVRKTFAPSFASLGPPRATDTPGKRQLRSILFFLIGSIGEDPAAIAQAREVADRYLDNPASVDPTLASTAVAIASQSGDKMLFDRLQKVSQTTNNPTLQEKTLFALARFREPSLVERALQYAISGKVKNQDSAALIAFELYQRATRDQAWTFVQQNWPGVQAQITTSSGQELVGATGNFCSADRLNEVSAFFAEHPVKAAETELVHAKDHISDCIQLRGAQQESLARWLGAASSPLNEEKDQ